MTLIAIRYELLIVKNLTKANVKTKRKKKQLLRSIIIFPLVIFLIIATKVLLFQCLFVLILRNF